MGTGGLETPGDPIMCNLKVIFIGGTVSQSYAAFKFSIVEAMANRSLSDPAGPIN